MTQVILGRQLFAAMARLAPSETAAAVKFIEAFQQGPERPGFSVHRIRDTPSRNLWSARVSSELRAVLAKEGDTWAILHVDHHDAAYAWAERRKVVASDISGFQIVDVVEVQEVVETIVTRPVHREPRRFEHHDDAYLLSLGLPGEWLPMAREVRTDDDVLDLAAQLDEAAAERLMRLAEGHLVEPPRRLAPGRPVHEAADARRQFYVVAEHPELLRVLEGPLDAWMAFLHPTQRDLVERDYAGPAKVTGAAGTGKTVVAMHRARRLAHRGERVLFASFVTTLCDNVARQLDRLCTPADRARIAVATVHKVARDIVLTREPAMRIADARQVAELLEAQRLAHAPAFDAGFVRSELDNVVQRQGLSTWADYRAAARTGRGTALGVRDRQRLWRVFSGLREALAADGAYEWSTLCLRAAELVAAGEVRPSFTAVIVDELQDLRPPELRLIRALAAPRPEHLFMVGDAGQRIYPGGFSLRALGIDVVGRATVLRVNYRTTEQIRRSADRVLGDAVDDMDGATEDRRGTRSLLRGPAPTFEGFPSPAAELQGAVAAVEGWRAEGRRLDEIAIFARSSRALRALEAALAAVDIPTHLLSDKSPAEPGRVHLGTMHRAKGLEFKAVLVHGAGADTVPHPKALASATDPRDRQDALDRERRLLYVAMTRARDELRVTWTGAPSPFLEPQTRAEQDGGQA